MFQKKNIAASIIELDTIRPDRKQYINFFSLKSHIYTGRWVGKSAWQDDFIF